MAEICEICGGLGVVTKNVPLDHPDFGKSFPCPNCDLGIHRQRNTYQKLSRLEEFSDYTFLSFQSELYYLSSVQKAMLEAAYRKAYSYAQNPDGWLLIQGSYGVGKTHLAAAIGHECLARGEKVIFSTTPDLLDYLRAAYAPNAEVSYDQKFDQMCTVPLLILDDLGAESATPWAQEKLYQLINARYRTKLPTVITTNMPLEKIDSRIVSRMLDTELNPGPIAMDLPDFRRQGSMIGSGDELGSLHSYSKMTFRSLQFPSKPEYQDFREQVTAIHDYAQNPQGWLLITGHHGAGKTHLAAAVANHRYASNAPVMMMRLVEFLDYLRATFDSKSDISLNERFLQIRNSPLLVLDDFHLRKNITPWSYEKLLQLIDYRHLNELPTVIVMHIRYLSKGYENFLVDNHPDFHTRISAQNLVMGINLNTPDYRNPQVPKTT